MNAIPRCRTRPLVAALVAGLGLGLHAAAFAATRIAVTHADDAGTAATCTLRQAIAAMNSGATTGSACVASTISGVDTIVFDTSAFPPDGANTITLADAPDNQLSIADPNLVIDASASGNVTVQRSTTATNAFGILYDISYGALTLDSLTIANGKLVAPQPSQYDFGAGIACVCSNLTLRNSTVSGNVIASSAYAAGGGVFVYAGDLTMTGSTVSDNSVSGLSGASGMGGGVFVRPDIDTHAGGNTTLVDSKITGNTAQGNGGGLHVGGTLAMTGSAVTGNSAASGGGIKVYGAATLTRSTISGNTASSKGGGILAASGYYGVPAALLTLDSTTLSGNQATSGSARGGGLYTRVGDLLFINSTIAGNAVVGQFGYGGGLFVLQNSQPITMRQTTVAANVAGNRGGGLMISISSTAAVAFDGTLFTNTDAPAAGGGNIGVTTGGIAIDGVGNLEFPGPAGDINASFANPPLSGDPLLGALADNGGPTHTMQPGAGSPAINAIACAGAPPVDQRGMIRPDPASANATPTPTPCDIGAVEADSIADRIFADGFE